MRLTFVLATLAVAVGSHVAQDKPAVPEPVTLNLAIQGMPHTLDPHYAGDALSMDQSAHAYEAPLEYDPFHPGKVRPCLLASMPTQSEDGLTWTLKLRDDVQFTADRALPEGKGRAVTAADFIFSWKRLVALRGAGGWLLEGVIRGLDEFSEAAGEFSEDPRSEAWWKHIDKPVSGLRAIDARTLEVVLVKPRADFHLLLASLYLAPIAREAARADTLETTPVGTGPFVLEAAAPYEIAWKRNVAYRRTTLDAVPAGSPLKSFEGRALPLLDRIRYTLKTSATAEVAALLAGELHRARAEPAEIFNLETLPKAANLAEALKDGHRKKGFLPTRTDLRSLDYVAFNMNDPVVGSPAGKTGTALRRALALATDRDRFVAEAGAHRMVPANSLTRPGIVGHDAKSVLECQRFDPTEGRKLLESAGFTLKKQGESWVATDADGNQPKIKLSMRSDTEKAKHEGELIAAGWAQVGIAAEIECLSFGDFLQQIGEDKHQAAHYGWVYDLPDATNMFQLLYGPNSVSIGHAACFRNDKFDREFEQLLLLDEDGGPRSVARRKKCIRLHEIIDSHTPWITLIWRVSYTLDSAKLAAPDHDVFRYGSAKYMALR